MNKGELVSAVADKAGLKREQAESGHRGDSRVPSPAP